MIAGIEDEVLFNSGIQAVMAILVFLKFHRRSTSSEG
jgi:hypothetical protein